MKSLHIFAIIILLFSSSAFAVEVIPFVSPYNSYAAGHSFFTTAEESMTISVYILSSSEIASMLADLEKKGVKVKILVEGGPVGGIADFKPVMCALQEAGAEIKLYTGDFRFTHAKFAVKDGDEVLVATENFASTSFSPKKVGNKGYGIIVKDASLAWQLLQIYEKDVQDSKPLDCTGIEKVNLKDYPDPSDALTELNADSIELIATPLDEQGIEKIEDLLRNSKSFLYIEQQYIKNWGQNINPFLSAALEANAKIRILLDSSWYNNQPDDEDSNTAIAKEINRIAQQDSIDAIAKVYEGNKYERIHAKLVISKNYAFVSSINWNKNSPTENREMGVIVYSPAVSNYYKAYFESDFENQESGTGTIQNPLAGFAIADNSLLLIAIITPVIVVLLLIIIRKKM